MIHVSYSARLGNNLFQFAFGAVLSRLSGEPMAARPIPGFPGTDGFSGPCPTIAAPIPLHGFDIDLQEWAERAKHEDILVRGYPHNTAYYEPHRAWLAPMLTPADGDWAHSTEEDVVLHVRLGDYFSRRRHNIDRFGYPVEAICKLLTRLDYTRCVVVTDSPQDEVIARLVREHRGVIAGGDREHDYRTLFHARRLILSPSTFGWWAAWTGHAAEIYFPHEMGYWQSRHRFRLTLSQPGVRRYNAHGELL